MEFTITEAARVLGVAEKTVRRRVHSGELRGIQVPTRQGFIWKVELPDHEVPTEDNQVHAGVDHNDGYVDRREMETMRHMLELMQGELATKNEQIKELHVLLQQSAALPAPQESRPWWRFW